MRGNHTYRCTRPDLYPPGSLGHLDSSARQGHYISAISPSDAAERMHAKWPDDRYFDVQLWDATEARSQIVSRYIVTSGVVKLYIATSDIKPAE